MGLIMAYDGGLWGNLTGLTKSTDHPSRIQQPLQGPSRYFRTTWGLWEVAAACSM